MTMQNFGVDPLVLEESDLGIQALFQSFIPQGANQIQQQQLGSLFQPTFNQFLGQIGNQVRQGGAPTLTFSQFLEDNFNPQRALLRTNRRSSAGGGPTLFNFFS